MIIIYLAQVGKDKFGKAGRPMDMPILPSLKLKLQDSRQFYHKMYRYSIKVVTAIFITWLSPRSMGVSGTEAQKKQLSEKSFTLLSLHNEHTWASSLFLTERTEEKDQICWRNKKMSRTGNQLLSNLVYKREHDSSPEQHPTMAENINKAIALSWSQRPMPHPLTSCRLADMIWPGPVALCQYSGCGYLAFHQLIFWCLGSGKAACKERNESFFMPVKNQGKQSKRGKQK